MRLLLDENVPIPLSTTLKTLLRTHEVTHRLDLDGWKGTKDPSLYGLAVKEGFEVILTNDAKQMQRPQEVEAIARAGIHRVQYPHKHPGLAGIGLAVAVVCASLPAVLEELSEARGQRLIVLKGIDPSPGSRYTVCDPAVRPPKFWPGLNSEA